MYVVTTNEGKSIVSLDHFLGPLRAREFFDAKVEDDPDAVNLYQMDDCSLEEARQRLESGDKSKCRLVLSKESYSYEIARLARDLDLDL